MPVLKSTDINESSLPKVPVPYLSGKAGVFFPPIMGGKRIFGDYFPPIMRDPGGKNSCFLPPIFETLGGKSRVFFPPYGGKKVRRRRKILRIWRSKMLNSLNKNVF